MIICHRCGKENQDMYKFCLGCGAELRQAQPAAGGDGNVAMMKTMMADSSNANPGPQSQPNPAAGQAPAPGLARVAPAQPQAPQPSGPAGGPQQPQQGGGMSEPASRTCGACGADVPTNFKFCGVCGTPMAEAPPPAQAAAPPQAQPAPAPQATAARITLIRPDGSEGGVYDLQQGENKIGREQGGMFESDGYLSPVHAALTVSGASATIEDMNSLNGVFVRMTQEEELQPGQIIRLGQELLRFDLIEPPAPLEDGTEIMGSPNPGYWGKITVIIGKEVDGGAYPLIGESVTIGRERGDINFPDDGYVSGLHAKLTTRDGRVYLTDLGSSNGTFMKVAGKRALANDSYILLGQQLFRLSL